MTSWFNDTIRKEDRYEVSKAKAEINVKFRVGCIVARNLVVLIHQRFYTIDTTLSLNTVPEVR